MPLPTDRDAWAEYSHLVSVGVTPEVAALVSLGIAGGRLRARRIPHGHVRGYWLERSRGLITCPPCRRAHREYCDARNPNRSRRSA